MSRSTRRLELRGVALTLGPTGTVRLDDASTLLVGDLHLGRATLLQRAGLGLPDGSDADDLERLAATVASSEVERVILLGDVVHAQAADGPTLRRQLARLGTLPVDRVEALPGNHDPRLGELLAGSGVRVLDRRVRLAGADLAHRPRTREAGPQARLRVAAHLHPVARLGRGPGSVRLPAFVVDPAELIVPAFGATTGGVAVTPGPSRRIFVATGTAVHEVPRRAPAGVGAR